MSGPRVLLADPDAYARRVAEISLNCDGFAVTPVQNADEAIDRLIEGDFDLVVLDAEDPRAVEICREIRSQGSMAALPVLMLVPPGDVEGLSAREAGATGYIVKPFDPPNLGDQVRKACSSSLAA